MAVFTAGALPVSAYWVSIAASDSQFVLLTDASCMVSSNGISWQSVTLPHSGYSGIAYGNGLFVAVRSGYSDFSTSPDGINWTARTNASGDTLGSRVKFANGRFFTHGGVNKHILTCTDGISWQSIATPLLPSELNAEFVGIVAWYGAATSRRLITRRM
jgi:hypothetical protein